MRDIDDSQKGVVSGKTLAMPRSLRVRFAQGKAHRVSH